MEAKQAKTTMMVLVIVGVLAILAGVFGMVASTPSLYIGIILIVIGIAVKMFAGKKAGGAPPTPPAI